MPASSPPLTLIVAATRTMGIGRQGTLPWPPLKQEMAYFARVTKRPPLSTPFTNQADSTPAPTINAVIMGRKTWNSIPARFRPLKGRVNVIVTRAPEKMGFPPLARSKDAPAKECRGEESGGEPAIAVKSISEGLRTLQSLYPPPSSASFSPDCLRLGRVFIIGGAEIYAFALQMPECERILLTRIQGEFECDTFFPVTLGEAGRKDEFGRGWVKQGKEDLDRWVGEEVLAGVGREGDVEYEFEMWERERGFREGC
ncbi:MAG: hypothetical protein Q9187_008776 [Circinaria calcarea]